MSRKFITIKKNIYNNIYNKFKKYKSKQKIDRHIYVYIISNILYIRKI